jgi:hypothetical protein
VIWHSIENAESSLLSLPPSGILLSQFLPKTEKKKRKSNRSGKSCQIRKRAFVTEEKPIVFKE